MAKSFDVEVVSAEQLVWSGRATRIIARTIEGEIGILAGHEPLLAVLGDGPVRVTLEDGRTIDMTAADGFLSVEQDAVRVVARVAQLAA
ncbi:F0F1 ATP synthase subunit epsilon [Pseudoclavibacter caeni]|jgi:F-type H+-transporting ATPase subunit epsilon|uniref:F0F1 ATP synthase subunit epsilon n=1 Tax=Pseudoclavibacter caeni TaxID=908846 RepID=A0A7C8BUE3_9MICO|nr:F0F1 ATP synthase subunit epsilon [Pseudoclavibacter caeni]KAB1632418.1 F0F1 ATP synthase subunit epsilon [Pseudoclavibacter caeni]NYJ97669.1 F-type H+-transporting ATPase subunit epsilon [Pseudoclavibacter caeni]